ncbi:hypothetical protein CCH79_00020376, partial [Gambusia affinis]
MTGAAYYVIDWAWYLFFGFGVESAKADDRKKQCNILLELLKKLQTCRSLLSTTIQKTEQTISDQASYIGKDNLQRSMAKVSDMKEELAGLGETIDDMKGACKRLQSELKKFPDCTDAPFEVEADTLLDSWLDITEKTDCYMDNLRVGLEMWEKQLMLGGEVDDWARSKLALFSEGNPFSNEQQVFAMRDEIQTNEENIEHFHKKSTEIQEILLSQEAPLELQVMETQLRKRMEQVKESFTDCTDVFEEIRADLDADLSSQEEHAEAVLKEVGLLSSVPSPPVLEELSNDCSSLREAIAHTKDIIRLKREERHLFKVISDERKLFEEWFQDLQLSVNECFESPESRSDGFINSEDTERRLRQLNDQLERAKQQVSSQQLSEFINWLKEQQEEVATFRAHCQSRQEQMESLLDDLNHVRGVALSELLASIRRQGVRAENILKDGDNLLQRYRNLETRLQKQATAQSVLDKEYNRFNSQAESIRTWISDFTQPLTTPSKDNTEEMKQKALASLLAGQSTVSLLQASQQYSHHVKTGSWGTIPSYSQPGSLQEQVQLRCLFFQTVNAQSDQRQFAATVLQDHRLSAGDEKLVKCTGCRFALLDLLSELIQAGFMSLDFSSQTEAFSRVQIAVQAVIKVHQVVFCGINLSEGSTHFEATPTTAPSQLPVHSSSALTVEECEVRQRTVTVLGQVVMVVEVFEFESEVESDVAFGEGAELSPSLGIQGFFEKELDFFFLDGLLSEAMDGLDRTLSILQLQRGIVRPACDGSHRVTFRFSQGHQKLRLLHNPPPHWPNLLLSPL